MACFCTEPVNCQPDNLTKTLSIIGMFEDGEREVTFSDLYSIDVKKLDEWKTVIQDDAAKMEWLGSDSESEEDDDDSDSGSEGDSEMETD